MQTTQTLWNRNEVIGDVKFRTCQAVDEYLLTPIVSDDPDLPEIIVASDDFEELLSEFGAWLRKKTSLGSFEQDQLIEELRKMKLHITLGADHSKGLVYYCIMDVDRYLLRKLAE